MKRVFLHLGSNVGQRLANLKRGLELLEAKVGKVVQTSSVYETEAWGLKGQDDFLNQVVEIETRHDPKTILTIIKDIEQEVGRTKGEKWGPRVLDIDVSFYGKEIVDLPNLQIPHPAIPNRNFVLIPLMEIAGLMVHPVLGKTIEDLYMESTDECEVWMYNDNERL